MQKQFSNDGCLRTCIDLAVTSLKVLFNPKPICSSEF